MSSKRSATNKLPVKRKRKKLTQSSLTTIFTTKKDGSGSSVIDLTGEESSSGSPARNACSSDSPDLSAQQMKHASSSTSVSLTKAQAIRAKRLNYKVYCDLDGVLVDFDAGVRKLFRGKSADDIPVKVLWPRIARSNLFFEHLPWTSDGMELWRELLRNFHSPNNNRSSLDILTGVPLNKSARIEKFRWCKREFRNECKHSNDVDHDLHVNHVDMAGTKRLHSVVSGVRKNKVVNIITCWSKNKHFESQPGTVLIDDNEKFALDWERRGGIFIHHTSAATTLEKLRARGVLSC